MKEGPSTRGDVAGLTAGEVGAFAEAVSLQLLGCSESMNTAVDRKVC